MSFMDNGITAGVLTRKQKAEIRQKTASELSGGEARRAGLVRAVVNKPSIRFAEEPTGALNAANSQAVLDVFSSLHIEAFFRFLKAESGFYRRGSFPPSAAC